MKKLILNIGLILDSTTSYAATEYTQTDSYTIQANRDYLANIPAQNSNGSVNAIIEIPTGSNQKWEVSKQDSSTLHWEFKNGQPRIVKYLGYPGNYGTVPNTALPKSLGGDGDPLDIIVLGPAQPRGSVAQVKVIGGLQMLDDGEQDDKLIAISLADSSSFHKISTIEQLQHAFPGIVDIVKIWFSHYKGTEGNIEIKGIMDSKQANTVLKQAVAHYQKSNQSS